MIPRQTVVGALVGFTILAVLAMLVYRKKLTEERAAIGLIAGLLIFIVSLSGSLQHLLGDLLGSKNVPATILAMGVLFLGAICVDLAVQNTRLASLAKNVSQEVALLERRVAELEAQCSETDGRRRVPDTSER